MAAQLSEQQALAAGLEGIRLYEKQHMWVQHAKDVMLSAKNAVDMRNRMVEESDHAVKVKTLAEATLAGVNAAAAEAETKLEALRVAYRGLDATFQEEYNKAYISHMAYTAQLTTEYTKAKADFEAEVKEQHNQLQDSIVALEQKRDKIIDDIALLKSKWGA